MKKYCVEFTYEIDGEYISTRRTFSDFKLLYTFIAKEFSTIDSIDDFRVSTYDTDSINNLHMMF